MADDLLKTLLERVGKQGLPEPQNIPKPSVWNLASGGQDPQLDRAVWKLQSELPGQLKDVTVKPMNWHDPFAGTAMLGYTRVDDPIDDQQVRVNPAASIAFPEDFLRTLLIHELEHVKQKKSRGSLQANIANNRQEQAINYWDRPSERGARDAVDRYAAERGLPKEFQGNQSVLDALPVEMDPIEKIKHQIRQLENPKLQPDTK